MLAPTRNQDQTYILQLSHEELIRDEYDSDSDSDTEEIYKPEQKYLKQYSILQAHDKEAFSQMNIAFDMFMDKVQENLVLQQSLIYAQQSIIDIQNKHNELHETKLKLEEMLDDIQKLAKGKNSPEWIEVQSILKDR